MIRRIITIDEEKCNGCDLCADACHEGAIGIVDSKAKLLREDYCDGLGDCLPACPMNAISFEEREAPAYNEAAVLAAKKAKEVPLPCGCPGSACQSIQHSAPAADVHVPSWVGNGLYWDKTLKWKTTSKFNTKKWTIRQRYIPAT